MLLRFSVCTGRPPGQTGVVDAAPWHSVDVILTDNGIEIGRRPGIAIELPFATVSGRHARIFRQSGGFWLEDLGSANGTCLGGRRLEPRVPMPIAAGEIAGIAGIEVRFDGVGDGGLRPPEPERESSTSTLTRRLTAEIFAACPIDPGYRYPRQLESGEHVVPHGSSAGAGTARSDRGSDVEAAGSADSPPDYRRKRQAPRLSAISRAVAVLALLSAVALALALAFGS
jgi:predicted component of type VI protein secretion system